MIIKTWFLSVASSSKIREVVFKDSPQQSHPPCICISLLSLKGRVYFPPPWIWVGLVTYSDQNICQKWCSAVLGLDLRSPGTPYESQPFQSLGSQLPSYKKAVLQEREASWMRTKALVNSAKAQTCEKLFGPSSKPNCNLIVTAALTRLASYGAEKCPADS